MPRIAVLFVALLWFAFANYQRPETMYRIYNWPLAPETEVSENVRTAYRRRGYVTGAIGFLFLVWGLLAS